MRIEGLRCVSQKEVQRYTQEGYKNGVMTLKDGTERKVIYKDFKLADKIGLFFLALAKTILTFGLNPLFSEKTQDQWGAIKTGKITLILKNKLDKQPLSYKQLIKKASKQFADDPDKKFIMERIEKRLQEVDYKGQLASGKVPHITLHWEDTLWGHGAYNLSEHEKKVICAATSFISANISCNILK